jgi:hypothetical protein
MAHEAYGPAHQRARIAAIRALKNEHLLTGRWPLCPRCGLTMAPDPLLRGEGLDLGHSDPERKRRGLPGDRLEHSACNRSFGDGSRTPADWTSVDW